MRLNHAHMQAWANFAGYPPGPMRPMPMPYRRPPRSASTALLTGVLLLLLSPFILMLATLALGTLVMLTEVTDGATLPIILVVVLLTLQRGRRRRWQVPVRPPIPVAAPPPPPAVRPEQVWAHAKQRFYTLRGRYAAYECDPMAVLRLPALADVSVASTARFVDAFAEAQALETDRFPPPEHAGRFVAAVEAAERAWQAANDAAERIRLSGLSPAERVAVERVIKLLTTARDTDSDPERLAAYARARSELTKLDRTGAVHLPRTAQARLDEASRGMLSA